MMVQSIFAKRYFVLFTKTEETQLVGPFFTKGVLKFGF